MIKVHLIPIFLATIFCCSYGADPILTEQPDYVIPCQIKDPEFIKCSTRSIQKFFDQLSRRGISTLKGFEPMDPLKVPKISLEQGGTSAANLKIVLTDYIMTGLKDTKVTESRVSNKDYSWETRLLMPQLKIKSNYDLDGRLLLLNLKGKGDLTMDLENMKVVWYTKTKLYEKEGYTFYNITNIKVNLTPSGVKVHLNNLFNGNKELEDSTNQLFNENWQDFFEALRDTVSQALQQVFMSVLGRVFHHIPAKYFVSDIPTSTELYS